MIRLEKKSNSCYLVYFQNGVLLGEFLIAEDGYYVFWPNKTRYGFWESQFLKLIAEKLDELNKSWDTQVHEYFEKDKR